MLMVDRPGPVEYADKTHGVEFMIAFRWGETADDRPHEVVVLTTHDGRMIVAGTEKGPWSTVEQAISVGQDLAEQFVAKHWVD